MNALFETKYILKKYDIKPNKSLGQNFLVDDDTLEVISNKANKDDLIIEIGPGIGTLTSLLLEKAKKVIAIELDKNMIKILNDRFKLYDNFELINEDILKVNIEELIQKNNFSIENTKIIANLPYYITTDIITKLIKTKIKEINILIQKEVAQRLCAKTGTKDAGAITYYVKYYADVKKEKDVKASCFLPSPKVDSAFISINKLENKRVKVENEELFFKLIKENFSKRRKTLINSLSNVVEKEKLEQILLKLNINVNIRGENLNIQDFANICNEIEKGRKED